jgi:uncharacterized protein
MRQALVMLVVTFAVLSNGCSMSSHGKSPQGEPEATNLRLVKAAFERWRTGTGGPFELLPDEATWTIIGSSPVSKTYPNKEHFMSEVIRPFNARMERPLRPTIRQIHSAGDTVIILFDAESLCVDGKPYRNTYAWFMQMKDRKAVNVTAFFDTRLFDEMWTRVQLR